MRKSNLNKLAMSFALALCAASTQACFVDSNAKDCYTQEFCTPVCETVCEERCSWGYCYDDCWETCSDSCHYDTVCYDVPECYDSFDCRDGKDCRNGKCVGNSPNHSGGSNNNGYRQLCETCSDSTQCAGQNSLCVELEHTGETICATSCINDNGCQAGYQCNSFKLGDSASVGQCVPSSGSCKSNYCRKNDDCFQPAICQNNTCTINYDDIN